MCRPTFGMRAPYRVLSCFELVHYDRPLEDTMLAMTPFSQQLPLQTKEPTILLSILDWMFPDPLNTEQLLHYSSNTSWATNRRIVLLITIQPSPLSSSINYIIFYLQRRVSWVGLASAPVENLTSIKVTVKVRSR